MQSIHENKIYKYKTVKIRHEVKQNARKLICDCQIQNRNSYSPFKLLRKIFMYANWSELKVPIILLILYYYSCY